MNKGVGGSGKQGVTASSKFLDWIPEKMIKCQTPRMRGP